MELRDYLINKIDAELINNKGIAKPFILTVHELEPGMSDSCQLYKKTLLRAERIEGKAYYLMTGIKSQLPSEVNAELEIFERRPQMYTTDPYQDVRVRYRIAPSQAYATKRYSELFLKNFYSILNTKRQNVLNDFVSRIQPGIRYNICSKGIRVPYDDDYKDIKTLSEFKLQNLETKEQIFTLAKCITDTLNRDDNIYEMRTSVPPLYLQKTNRLDFSVDIYAPYGKMNKENTNLQSW